MSLRIHTVLLVTMAIALAWAQPQASRPLTPGLSDLSTSTATANLLYQTKERVVVLLQKPTPLAFSVLRDLGNRGVELYLLCPSTYLNACRSFPGLAGLAVSQTPPQPMWILDGTTLLISPYLDAGFDDERSFALTSKSAAQMLEEILATFFTAP